MQHTKYLKYICDYTEMHAKQETRWYNAFLLQISILCIMIDRLCTLLNAVYLTPQYLGLYI